MKVSATEGGIGSVATSAVPILATTLSTSGNSLMRASSASACRSPASRPVPGMRSACSAMSPSSRLGTNSLPRRVASSPLRSDQQRRRPPATATRCASARRSSGAVPRLDARHQPVVALARRGPVMNRATAAGTKVSDSSMRRGQRDDHGERHRVEHLSLDAGQREDRQVDRGDDQHAEQAGLHHFGRCARRDLEALVPRQRAARVDAASRRSDAGSSRR